MYYTDLDAQHVACGAMKCALNVELVPCDVCLEDWNVHDDVIDYVEFTVKGYSHLYKYHKGVVTPMLVQIDGSECVIYPLSQWACDCE